MYRSILLIAISVSCCGQLLAQDVKPRGSDTVEHAIQISEIVLTGDEQFTLEEIAANSKKYFADGKVQIVQLLALRVQDGCDTTLIQSEPVDLLLPPISEHRFQTSDATLHKKQAWIGFAVGLSAKANEQSLRVVLKYHHSFVSSLSPDSKEADVVIVKAEKTIDLNIADPGSIAAVPVTIKKWSRDAEGELTGSKRFLIVSLDQND